MIYDFVKNTHYNDRRRNTNLQLTQGVRGLSGHLYKLTDGIVDELSGVDYVNISESTKRLLDVSRLEVRDAYALTCMIERGAMEDDRLYEDNYWGIIDMIPFMSESVAHKIKERLITSHLNTQEVLNRVYTNDGGSGKRYNLDTDMLYFIQEYDHVLFNRLMRDNRGTLEKPYLTELLPLEGKRGIVEFLRDTGTSKGTMYRYYETVPLDIWYMNSHLKSRLINNLDSDRYLDPNYIIRNGYLGVPKIRVVERIIDTSDRINPDILHDNKDIINERILELYHKTYRHFSKSKGISGGMLDRRERLIKTMMYLTVHDIYDYRDKIKTLGYDHETRG